MTTPQDPLVTLAFSRRLIDAERKSMTDWLRAGFRIAGSKSWWMPVVRG